MAKNRPLYGPKHGKGSTRHHEITHPKPVIMSKPSITFLSWNLCLFERSDQAPLHWRTDNTEAKVRELVLELNPDFVFFQELPGIVPYVETHDMVPANRKSHSGDIATLAKKELMDDLKSWPVPGAVMTEIKSLGLTIANVHLRPGGGAGWYRVANLNDIKQETKTDLLFVAGDTNTRLAEIEHIEQVGLIGDKPPEPTWDSHANKYRAGGREYTAYYTRYFHTDNLKVRDVKVWSDPIVDDKFEFHLSDHFPISGKVEIA